jgi:hypothetical protein
VLSFATGMHIYKLVTRGCISIAGFVVATVYYTFKNGNHSNKTHKPPEQLRRLYTGDQLQVQLTLFGTAGDQNCSTACLCNICKKQLAAAAVANDIIMAC